MTVYNWQFVHCLHLWAALLGAVPDSQLMKPLVYPLVQVGHFIGYILYTSVLNLFFVDRLQLVQLIWFLLADTTR